MPHGETVTETQTEPEPWQQPLYFDRGFEALAGLGIPSTRDSPEDIGNMTVDADRTVHGWLAVHLTTSDYIQNIPIVV